MYIKMYDMSDKLTPRSTSYGSKYGCSSSDDEFNFNRLTSSDEYSLDPPLLVPGVFLGEKDLKLVVPRIGMFTSLPRETAAPAPAEIPVSGAPTPAAPTSTLTFHPQPRIPHRDPYKICTVCLEAMADTILDECSHNHVCSQCLSEIPTRPLLCPICREPVVRVTVLKPHNFS